VAEIDSFGEYVKRRLEEWGWEFSLAHDCDYLGHQSKNMLQILIEHKGEMPGKTQGYKPMEVSTTAHQIELMVTEIARDQPRLACVLRAYYCGNGRRKVERYETSLMLIAGVERDQEVREPLPKVDRYLRMVEVGTAQIRGMLVGLAQAA
jgi:hypothetical protein